MTDLLELMTRAVAEQPPVTITRESSIAAGRRAVRRRRTGLAALSVTGAAALVATAIAVPRALAPVSPPSNVVTYPVPQLPAAGVPGAIDRPDLVGSDPLLIHFGVASSAWPLSEVWYSSANGTESVRAGALQVMLGRSEAEPRRVAEGTGLSRSVTDPSHPNASPSPIAERHTSQPTTVDGRSATLFSTTFADGTYPRYGLLWQPAAGLWLGISAETETGVAELWSDVDALDLSRAYRVVVPFRLKSLPPGARVLDCTAGLPAAGEPLAASFLTVGGPDGRAAISIGQPTVYPAGSTPATHGPQPSLPAQNRTVAGHSVFWTGGYFFSNDWDGVPITVGVEDGYGEAEATRILAGLQVSKNLTDPTTWPTSPTAG
ncbi:MAG: hypothetical protein J2P15_11245 [Micromonosporaceae bacterium]|nr:hypothetical protein [Micromonosporaceae bacterium]